MEHSEVQLRVDLLTKQGCEIHRDYVRLKLRTELFSFLKSGQVAQ